MSGWLVPNLGKVASDPGGDAIIHFPDGGDGDPSGAYTEPGAGASWTNFIAGTTSSDTAFAAAGYINVEFGGQTGRIPWFRRT